MDTRALKRPRLTTLTLACLGITLGACSENGQNTAENEGSQVDAIEAALESPVIKCQEEQASCVGTAKDPSAVRTCNGGFQTCLEDAAKQGQEAMKAIQACRDQARECVTKGGANGAATCRMDYESCVEQASGAPSNGDAAGAGGAASEPRFPLAGGRAPRLPIAGGFAFPMRRIPRLPGAGAAAGGRLNPFAGRPAIPEAGRGGLPPTRPTPPFEKCFADLRECVRAPGSKPEQCAMAARMCLRSAERRPEAGAGGSAGAAGSTP